MKFALRSVADRKRAITNCPNGHYRVQDGFSLIELMIGMTLGLMLIAVITSIFLSSNRNYNEDDRFSRMQENGRFAINTLVTDLSMASFWGTLSDPSEITSGLTAVCGMAFDANNPVMIVNNPASGSAVTSTFSCVNASNVWTGGSTHADVIAIKRVVGNVTPSSSSPNPAVYLQIDNTVGTLLSTSPSAFVSGDTYWQYIPRIYFIRNYSVTAGDGIPTLCRKELNGAGTGMSDVALIEGVENIQMEFGIDTDGDGIPNQYDSNPSATDIPKIVNAKIYVLVRSLTQDKNNPANSKTYNLGSVTIDYSSTPDHYYRRVFDGTISLRNLTSFTLLGTL